MPQLSWSSPIRVGFAMSATSSANRGSPGVGYSTSDKRFGKP